MINGDDDDDDDNEAVAHRALIVICGIAERPHYHDLVSFDATFLSRIH